MNLNSLDLNLLVALDALLREASVSRAAMRIGLSQPAASHALQRLRDLIGDPLLVRTGARMELTPRAQGLRGPLAQALEQVRGLFTRDEFDASRSERHFRLMMPDLAVELLMPPLMEKVTKLAPNVTIDVVPWRSSAIMTPEFARTIDLVCSIGDGFKGKQLPLASKYSFNLGAQYGTAISAWDDGSWFARADFSWKDKQYLNAANLTWIKARSVVNLRAGVSRGALTVDAFVNNVFDDDNYVAGFQGSVLTPTFSLSGSENYAILGLPDLRTYGARVSYKF